MSAGVPVEVAIVGGGRWGKVLCRVLAGCGRVARIHMVSRRNARGVNDWLADKDFAGRVAVHRYLDPVIGNPAIASALVANLPSEHFETAQWLLEHGKHVLVEKPFVATRAEAETLVRIAGSRRLVLGVGLEYLLASYVQAFCREFSAGGETAERAAFVWHDVPREERWGLARRPDATTHVTADLMPHVLTMLTALLGPAASRVGEFGASNGGRTARLKMTYGTCEVNVSLSRGASEPRRTVALRTAGGREYGLDFTREPGVMTVDGRPLPPDDRWQTQPRPLAAEIDQFLDEIANPQGAWPLLASRTLHIVEATEAAAAKAREAQLDTLHRELVRDYPHIPAPEAVEALREHLTRPLVEAGLAASPQDEEALTRWTRVAFRVTHKLSCHPFATQLGISEELGIDREALRRLNTVLRESDFVQAVVVDRGQARQYWHNTVFPIAQSGALAAALAGEYRYPFRIGLYPGVSCMFSCTFCGRHPDAHYDHGAVPYGNEVLKSIFRSAPANDASTFYISGGLEPLTNPGIGELVQCGAARGFRLFLYTNGYVLTPRLLDRQPGLWELDALRISCYGVDDATATTVTRRDNAFSQVMRNAMDFLRLRNERGAALKLGFNFVVLPGCAEQVLRLAEVIADINRRAGGRPIDFLTLREDYSARGSGIGADERARMVDIFAQLAERLRQPDLQGLHVDYGYALQAIRAGQAGRGLEMAERSQMRRRGYPQISVVVDLLGDVYLYREAGFIERPGARRYIIGRVGPDRPLQSVVADFVRSGIGIEPGPDDTRYFDSFDHVVTRLLHQAEADAACGLPFAQGPVRGRVPVVVAPAAATSIPTFVRHVPGRGAPFDAGVVVPVGRPSAPALRP